MKTAIIYDDVFLKHDLPTHPENSLRLKYFLKSLPQFDFPILKPKPVSFESLEAVHSKNYIDSVRISCREYSPGFFDPDTYYNSYTYSSAVFAAGAVEKGVELLLNNKYETVFCAVRPPGHHAERDRAKGFCIFNNVAIGAARALILGIKKVFIVDFDAHHGNGTQHTFYINPNVFYFSTHQYPFYPGTGSKEENNEHILNIPIQEGSGDSKYKEVYGEFYRKSVETFKPEIILVSAGYDLHKDDPLSNLEVTDKGVRFTLEQILLSAKELSIPILFTLEGGYNFHALERCGKITFQLLKSI
ncbi:histone deacetylase family protein [Desulfurobacterium thermolithotrophum]|uniref:histone deacetylase family protein n=1 Tax=Desulfurobacterium thermolithotrophum TaxID=64160 RepID=UPI0013CFCB58|nr:histone deacetylase [Desulfurobacterium thermolithotrophum]